MVWVWYTIHELLPAIVISRLLLKAMWSRYQTTISCPSGAHWGGLWDTASTSTSSSLTGQAASRYHWADFGPFQRSCLNRYFGAGVAVLHMDNDRGDNGDAKNATLRCIYPLLLFWPRFSIRQAAQVLSPTQFDLSLAPSDYSDGWLRTGGSYLTQRPPKQLMSCVSNTTRGAEERTDARRADGTIIFAHAWLTLPPPTHLSLGHRQQQQILRNVRVRIDQYVRNTDLQDVMPRAIMSSLVNNKVAEAQRQPWEPTLVNNHVGKGILLLRIPLLDIEQRSGMKNRSIGTCPNLSKQNFWSFGQHQEWLALVAIRQCVVATSLWAAKIFPSHV